MVDHLASTVAAAKNAVLPSGAAHRQLPLGLGRGVRLQIDFRRHTKLFLGLYEVELNRFIRELCQPGRTSFDVGAQSGYDALVFAKLTRAKVRSFECDADAAAEIRSTFAQNPELSDCLEVWELTVAAQSDPARRQLSLDEAAYGSQGFVPDFVKVDVDGAETEALAGAKRLLDERHPHLIVETHSLQLERECASLLCQAGYQPSVIDQRRWLRDHRPIPHNRWLIARGS